MTTFDKLLDCLKFNAYVLGCKTYDNFYSGIEEEFSYKHMNIFAYDYVDSLRGSHYIFGQYAINKEMLRRWVEQICDDDLTYEYEKYRRDREELP